MKIRLSLRLALYVGLFSLPPANHATNLLINGGFEQPPGIYPYQVFSASEGSMPGWTIASGTVEITAGTYWQAAEGAQSLDLNGIFESIGTIYQDVSTTPGRNYRVRFAYAGNPECGLPALKTADVYWNDQLLTNLSFDITGYNKANVGWIYYEQTVSATSSNSRIRFQATSPTFCGLTLDDVSVSAAWMSPTNQCSGPPAGIAGWWPAENSAEDIAGQLTGTTPFGISYGHGRVGQAFDFHSNRRVSLPDADALKLTHSLTIEAWVLIRSYGGFILFRGDNRPGLDPYVLMADGQGRLQFHIESESAAVNLLTPIPSNTWQHVAATLDGNNGDLRLFVNGALVAEANTTVRPFRDLDAGSEPAVGIGNHGGTFHNFPFDGLIDELAIYNRALSPAEIQLLFTAGGNGKCQLTNPPPAGSAVPVISSFNPVAAAVGSTVTLTGTNFSPAASENIVFFGAVRATVTAASVNSVTVTVPTGATYAPITLSVSGLVACASQPFQPTFAGNSANITTESFAPRFDLAGGDGAHRAVIADLDGDGKPDITVADVYGHTISLFRNISSSGTLSNGSFAPRVVLPAEGGVSDNPYGIVVADVDGDAKLDIVVCDRLGNNVSVYRNQASPGNLDPGSFAPHVNFSVGADPRYARVADLDGDGRPDIVTANYAANTVSILRNIGVAGSLDLNSFAPAVNLPAANGPYDIAAGDLDGDSKPDLALVCATGPTLIYRNLAAPGALTTNSFAAPAELEAVSGNIAITLGDIDGDGKSDLIIGSYQSGTISIYRNQSSPGTLTTNSFAPRVDFSNGNWTHTVALSDLNGDARTDIATVGELSSYLSVYQNLSTPGNFTNGSLAGRVDFGAGWNAWGLSIGDLDGDGRPDMVFCNAYDDTVSIYQNIVAFTNAPPPQTNSCVSAPAGLVGWWRMEGDESDSADGNHGTLLNGASFAAGKVGQALNFDGIDDHFRVADQPNLRMTNSLTVEAWIFPTSLGGYRCIMSKWDAVVGPDQRSFTMGLQPDGRAFFGLSPDGIEVGATVLSSNAVPLNQWTYLAVTYDGTALRIYRNGVVQNQTPYTQGVFPGTSDIGMGANVGGAAAGDVSSPFAALFAGMIDEPGIYNRALSASEISAIYNAGSAGKCVVSNPAPASPILTGPITNTANGHWYYLLDATNWPAAEAIAVSLGGHLVTINDAAENGWVVTNFSSFGGLERPLWIGLTDQASEGNWQWISSDPSSYRNWSPIEPNSGGGYFPDEDHALIWHPSSGYPLGSWNDAPSNQVWFAVVEVAPLTNAPSTGRIAVAPSPDPGNEFRLRFTGEPGESYFIEATCDWVTWELLGPAASLGNGEFEFVDPNAGQFPGRFYRIVSP